MGKLCKDTYTILYYLRFDIWYRMLISDPFLSLWLKWYMFSPLSCHQKIKLWTITVPCHTYTYVCAWDDYINIAWHHTIIVSRESVSLSIHTVQSMICLWHLYCGLYGSLTHHFISIWSLPKTASKLVFSFFVHLIINESGVQTFILDLSL